MEKISLSGIMAIIIATATLCLTSSCKKDVIPGESMKVEIDGEDITMIYIAPATFTMGGTPEQTDCDYFTEKPAHKVVLTKGYYISQTEVTQELWTKVMGSNPSAYKGDGNDEEHLPVTNVSWAGNPTPRVAEVYGGMMNAIGLQNPGIDLFCKRDIPFLKKYDTKIIVNVCGHAPEEYLAVVERLAEEPIDMMEINISCPNVNAGFLAFGLNMC